MSRTDETTTDETTTDESSERTEPDYRFTLANERTFLAWIRTSFGLLAGGVAVGHLVPLFGSETASAAVSIGCLLLALYLATGAFLRWRKVQRAMEYDRPLPSSPMMVCLASGSAVIALVIIVAYLST